MNPYVIIGAIVAVLGAYGVGHHYGWAERDTEMQLEIAKKNDEAREREQVLNGQLNEQSTKLKEANDAITKKQSSLDRLISAGRVRLNTSCVQAGSGAAATTGGGDEAASESERQTLRAIAEIVAQGDRNTEQLNACIDAYNAVRSQVNGQR